jgi:AcrR family transcriptional regulator
MDFLMNKKYQQLLSSAKELFLSHGIRRISIDEICKVSNVSKMTFYKYFENKTDLVKRILIKDMDEGLKHIDTIMAQKIPFPEKVKQIIIFKLKMIREYGDAFPRELREYPELSECIGILTERKMEFTMQVFAQGQKSGDIRKDINPAFYQFIIQQLYSMSMDKRLAEIFPQMDERVEELSNLALFGILED